MNKTYCIVTTTSRRVCVNVQSYMFYITYLNSSVKHGNECCTAYLRYLTIEATKLRPATWSYIFINYNPPSCNFTSKGFHRRTSLGCFNYSL